MSEQTLSALEFSGLLRVVQQYAVSALGRDFLAGLRPSPELSAIQARFREIQELQELEYRHGGLPLADFPELTHWLSKLAVRGSVLPAEAFNDLLTVLRLAQRSRHYLALGKEGVPQPLAALNARLHELPPLQEAVQQCISPHNLILDEASPALAAVRRELLQTRQRLNRQIKQTFFLPEYQDALQNPVISQRHGRYVIPVKADHKGAIPGIIHDQSQTKATLFVEPLAIVEQNNALNLLHNREKREEEEVLRRLSDLVRHQVPEVRETLAALAELDAINAKMRFAQAFKAREPIWRHRPGVDLRQARHPLLVELRRENPQAPPAVPVDIRLTPEQRFLIISGANAGGKTVALKTLGLLTLMVQSGIPIPVAEGSEFYPFDQVFADIGDPQDLHQSLSTFSAHLKRALEMLAELPHRALVLLDELGTATDPTEGGALALALLQALEQRGAYGAVTTHLPVIKGFAQRHPAFVNCAVVFNEETRRPTYRLAYGMVGASNALKIARELGLSPEILELAESYLDQEELRGYRLLAQVESAQQHLAQREEELQQRQEELARQVQGLEAERRRLEEEQHRFAEEAQKQARSRIRKAEAEFKDILARLQEKREPWGRLRTEFSQRQAELLQELTPTPAAAPPPTSEYVPGQRVFLPALGLTGEILSKDSHGRLEVRVRQVKIRVAPEEITPAAGGKAVKREAPVAGGYHVPPESLPSLNLVGLRVDEALPLVDRLLDQAMLQGRNQVDIIHGVGTGRLKKAVWEHLKRHAAVKDLHPDANPGVTVVDLKE